jgi:PHD/YefM family antitoxin component YafN of YafNO toxin-antitoxin module
MYNDNNMTVTIPHKLTQGKELIIVPLEEYEALVQLKEIYEFQPTASQKKALANARNNRKRGETLSLSELKRRLGFAD